MNKQLDISQEAIDEIRGGRKVSAIKLVRHEHGIGLKHAKELVDKYCDEHQIVTPSSSDKTSSGIIILIILMTGLLYSLYMSFK